ncbi:MAG: glycosyltransferase [Candidatus Nealsonbacteria bacterium]|nr:glycosyltransferase [Candidatus Nealsonbacteria bacterium]
MKIGFFTDYYLPSAAGVTVSIETFRKEMENRGHEVFIFAPASKNYKDKNPNVYRFRALTLSKTRDLYLALPFLPGSRKIQEILSLKLDVIHAQSPFSLGFLGKYIAMRQKIPFIYTHHTHLEEYAKFYLKENFFTPSLAKTWTTFFCNLSSSIITPSEKIKKVLKNYGVKKEISVLPTGVDLNVFKKSLKQRAILRKKLNIDEKSRVLMFVGRMEAEKNPLFLVEALKEVLKKKNNVFLIMIGTGPYEKKAKELAEKLGIEKFVKCTGRIPYEEIPSFYQGSDIFSFASLTETQGIVVLEAEAAGLPVVVLEDDVFAGIIKDGKNGFIIQKQKPEVFADSILKILEDKKLYNKFSEVSQKIAKSFSKEKQAKKLLDIYKKSLKDHENNNHSRISKLINFLGKVKSLIR